MTNKNNETSNNIAEQLETPAETPASTTATSGNNVTAFKNTMSKMYQAVSQAGTAGSEPGKAATQAQPTQPTTQASSTTSAVGSQKGAVSSTGAPEAAQQGIAKPAPTAGFVELQRNASPAVLTKLAQEIGVEEDRLKKLATTRGIRVLIDPDYLKVQ